MGRNAVGDTRGLPLICLSRVEHARATTDLPRDLISFFRYFIIYRIRCPAHTPSRPSVFAFRHAPIRRVRHVHPFAKTVSGPIRIGHHTVFVSSKFAFVANIIHAPFFVSNARRRFVVSVHTFPTRIRDIWRRRPTRIRETNAFERLVFNFIYDFARGLTRIARLDEHFTFMRTYVESAGYVGDFREV